MFTVWVPLKDKGYKGNVPCSVEMCNTHLYTTPTARPGRSVAQIGPKRAVKVKLHRPINIKR